MKKAGRPESTATLEALRLVATGITPYAAAKRKGIAFSTIYHAIKRRKVLRPEFNDPLARRRALLAAPPSKRG